MKISYQEAMDAIELDRDNPNVISTIGKGGVWVARWDGEGVALFSPGEAPPVRVVPCEDSAEVPDILARIIALAPDLDGTEEWV